MYEVGMAIICVLLLIISIGVVVLFKIDDIWDDFK